MSETNGTIFTQQTQPAAQGSSATAPNEQNNQAFADLLGSIKNERGEPKYKDVQTALEALRHSQEFIPQLKADKEKTEATVAALAAEVERLKTLEQTVSQLTQPQNQNQPTAASGMTEEMVASLLERSLTAREQQASQNANLQTVIAQMQQAFGADAEKTFYSKATEMGLSTEQVNRLAAQSPTAVLKLFGLEGKGVITTQQPSASGSINSAGLQPQVNSYIKRNDKTALIGATTADLQAERENSKKLVEELHNQGLSTYDLSDPKQYFKHFGNM